MWECLTVTVALPAASPLRITVSMSAMGSVQLMVSSGWCYGGGWGTRTLAASPGGLGHAWQRALVGEQAQGIAADAEFAQVGARTAGQLAAVAMAGRRAVGRQQAERRPRLHALLERELEVLAALAQRLALALELLDQLLALLILANETGLGHGWFLAYGIAVAGFAYWIC